MLIMQCGAIILQEFKALSEQVAHVQSEDIFNTIILPARLYP